ncbi:MAG: YdbL family protein [Xanthomonadales bacterium]|nr:YdbL family protein [Xanthomonadales bacterium]
MMKPNNWIRQIFAALLISLLTVSIAVADSPLTQPKADGLIGEQANGYLGLVAQNAPSSIKNLVADTNAKRKAGYQKIAAKQGTSLADVEKVGGNTAIEKTLPGNYIRDASGTWYKK